MNDKNLFRDEEFNPISFLTGELPKWALNAWKLTPFYQLFSQSVNMGMSFSSFALVLLMLMSCLAQWSGGLSPYLSSFFPYSDNFFNVLDSGLYGRFGVMLSLVLLLIFSYLTISKIELLEKTIDQVCDSEDENYSLFNKLPLYWVVLSIVPLPFFANLSINIYLKASQQNTFVQSAFAFLGVFVSIICFCAIYKILSKNIFSWNSVLLSSIIVAPLFELSKHIFLSLIFTQLGRPLVPGIIISSILLSLWLITSSMLYILGIRLAYISQFSSYHHNNDDTLFSKEHYSTREVALNCLLYLTEKFYLGTHHNHNCRPGIDAIDLTLLCRISLRKAKQVLRHLHSVGLLEILNDNGRQVALLRVSPESLTLDEFISRIELRAINQYQNIQNNGVIQEEISLWFWSEYSKSLKEKLGHLTIKDLYLKKVIPEEIQEEPTALQVKDEIHNEVKTEFVAHSQKIEQTHSTVNIQIFEEKVEEEEEVEEEVEEKVENIVEKVVYEEEQLEEEQLEDEVVENNEPNILIDFGDDDDDNEDEEASEEIEIKKAG